MNYVKKSLKMKQEFVDILVIKPYSEPSGNRNWYCLRFKLFVSRWKIVITYRALTDFIYILNPIAFNMIILAVVIVSLACYLPLLQQSVDWIYFNHCSLSVFMDIIHAIQHTSPAVSKHILFNISFLPAKHYLNILIIVEIFFSIYMIPF